MRVVHCAGTPAAVRELDAALRAAREGGPAVVPLGPGQVPPVRDPGPGQVVLATAGSTNRPKQVLLSVAALDASATASHARLGGPGHWLLALPVHHVAGLQVLVRCALTGTEPKIVDLRGGFDPDAFAAAARRLTDRAGGTGRDRCYTALVPAQLSWLLDRCPEVLGAFDAMLVGGAAVPDALLRRVREAGGRAVCSYGMTETAGGCVYDGWPLDGVRVRLRHRMSGEADEAGDNGAGRIELAGPMLATGYLDTGDTTGDINGATNGDTVDDSARAAFQDGWFRTFDLGQLDKSGRLRVLGRLDDLIISGGVNVAPSAVEEVLAGLPGVGSVCVVGLPDERWGQRVVAAVVPADHHRPPDGATLRVAARQLLTGAQTPKEIVLVDHLPLGAVGKPDRRAVRAVLAARLRPP